MAIGRFGPYVRFGSQFASLKKDDDPYTISRERALELVEEKKEAIIKATIKTFAGSEIKIMKGRWGAYVLKDRTRARIAKDVEAEKLSLEDCEKLIAEAPPPKGRAKKATKKKVVKKTAKKATKKKAVKKKATKKKAVKKKAASKADSTGKG